MNLVYHMDKYVEEERTKQNLIVRNGKLKPQ